MDRNAAGASETVPYVRSDPDKLQNNVKVVGNATLGDPKSIMIGIRNQAEDHLNKCAEVWDHELRLPGLNEEGGMAAIARVAVQLSELSRVNIAANCRSVVW